MNKKPLFTFCQNTKLPGHPIKLPGSRFKMNERKPFVTQSPAVLHHGICRDKAARGQQPRRDPTTAMQADTAQEPQELRGKLPAAGRCTWRWMDVPAPLPALPIRLLLRWGCSTRGRVAPETLTALPVGQGGKFLPL